MTRQEGPFGAPFHMAVPIVGGTAVAAWLLAVPLLLPVLGTSATAHDLSRALQTGLLAICAVAALPAVATARWRWPLVLLLLAAATATLRADRLDMAWREAATLLGLLAVAVVVAQALAQAGPRELLRWAVVAASGLYALAVLAVALVAGAADAPVQHAELIFGYVNRRHFNHVQTVAVLLCLLIAVEDTDARLRRLAIATAVCSLALLVLTLGRATILAGVAGVLAAAWTARSWRLLQTAAAAAAAGLALQLTVFQLWPLAWGAAAAAPVDQAVGHLTSDESRFELWAWAVATWREAPWFGVGPMHLAQRFNGIVAHPHNLPLQTLAEWGLMSTALAASLWGGFLLQLWRVGRQSPGAAGGLALMVAVAVDSLFSGNAVMPVSQVWLAVATGWAAHALNASAEAPPPARRRGRAFVAHGLLALALMAQPVVLAGVTASDWPGLTARLDATLERFPSAQRSPRFWSQGWF